MYRYYKKDEFDVMEYDFDSIMEFIDYLDNTPINTDIWDLKELGSNTDDYKFFKTHSLQEAEDLCKYGYHENFDKLIKLKVNLEKYIKKTYKRSKQYNYYVGYAPDVKAYLEGNPLSMFNRQNHKRKHIDIYYNLAVSCRTTTNQIFNRGVMTLCLTEMLEKMGFSVGLHVFSMLKRDGQIHFAKFNLKKAGERINVQKLFFPLCHPSFLRRLVVRLMEETPDIKCGWTHGYGFPCDDYTVRQIIGLKENNIVICKPEEMGVRGKNIVDDANAMVDYINKFTSEDIKLEHLKRERKL